MKQSYGAIFVMSYLIIENYKTQGVCIVSETEVMMTPASKLDYETLNSVKYLDKEDFLNINS